MPTVEERLATLEADYKAKVREDDSQEDQIKEQKTRLDAAFGVLDKQKERFGEFTSDFRSLREEVKREIDGGELKFQHNKKLIKNSIDDVEAELEDCKTVQVPQIVKKIVRETLNGRRSKFYERVKWSVGISIAGVALFK